MIVTDEGVRSAQPGEQHHAQLGVAVAEEERRLLEQLDRALVGDPGTPAGLLEADRGRREHVSVAEAAGDLRRGAERLHRVVRAARPEARGAELELRLGPLARIIDAELQGRGEAGLGLVEVERRQRRPAGQERVLDRAPRAVDRGRRAEVVSQLGEPGCRRVLAAAFQRLGDVQVQLGAAQPGQPS